MGYMVCSPGARDAHCKNSHARGGLISKREMRRYRDYRRVPVSFPPTADLRRLQTVDGLNEATGHGGDVARRISTDMGDDVSRGFQKKLRIKVLKSTNI